MERNRALLVGLVGLAVRGTLILLYPPVFGGDTILRLANWEHVLLSYQLPLPQAIIHVLHPLAAGPMLVRFAMAIAGALADMAFYLLASTLVTPRVALAGWPLFLAMPMIVTGSTVPYQEIFMLGGVFASFALIVRDRAAPAALCLAIACLARYESWLAVPLVAAAYAARRAWRPRALLSASALFGVAPLAWIVYNHGLTPPGSFAAETQFSLARFFRWVFLAWVAVSRTPFPTLVIALVGAAQVWRRGLWRQLPLQLVGGFTVLFLVAILFSAHGTSPDPERYVTSREAHWLFATIAVFGVLGLQALPRQRLVVGVCALTGLWMAARDVRAMTRAPDLAASVEAADYLDEHVAASEQVVVLAAPIMGVESYLDHVRATRGVAGRAAAMTILNTLDTRPPQFQRILVHSRLGKGQLQNYSSLIARDPSGGDTVVRRPVTMRHPAWIAMWNDFRPTSVGEAALAGLTRGPPSAAFFGDTTSNVRIFRVK